MNEEDIYPEILMFIGRFSTNGFTSREQVIECFTCGCCYWFAYILYSRFHKEIKCEIMIDYINNHFGCKIGNDIYDITGCVTNKYKWEKWDECNDSLLKNRIYEYCINF